MAGLYTQTGSDPSFQSLLDGDHAHKMLSELMAKSTLPNLFDTCPPFQIDGNFGAASGIAEMLLQSQTKDPADGYVIDLLPAMPSAWPTGRVTGLRARGGLEVDIAWKDGKLTEAVLRASLNSPAKVRYSGKTINLDAKARQTYRLDATLTAK